MTRNPKIHVVIRENDVKHVKKSFESNFSAKELKFDHKAVVSDNDNINF